MQEVLAKLCEPLEIDWSTFPQGIEVSALDGACVMDAAGDIVGRVSMCKTVDEETGAVTFKPVAFRADGTMEDPFVLAAGESLDFTCGAAGAAETTNELLEELIECLCGPCDEEPLGDQVTCSTEKMGADFVSNAAGEGTHTAGSMYTGSGPVTFSGTFTVTDSASATHTFTDGATVTGMASGAITSTTFTGTVEFVKNGETFRCPVTDKVLSANFTVQ